jgi:hypothetical protein
MGGVAGRRVAKVPRQDCEGRPAAGRKTFVGLGGASADCALRSPGAGPGIRAWLLKA